MTNNNGDCSFNPIKARKYYISVINDLSFEFNPVVAGENQIATKKDTLLKKASPIIYLDFDETDTTLLVGLSPIAPDENHTISS